MRKGVLAGSTRTDEENNIVAFWNVYEPASRWLRFATNLLQSRGSPSGATGIKKEYEEVRLYAMIGAAYVDATIANFDSKLAFYTWRPVTAIRKADLDGNPNTARNETWIGLRNPDASAEYPSATTAICAAAGKVLINYFQADLDLSATPIAYCEAEVRAQPPPPPPT